MATPFDDNMLRFLRMQNIFGPSNPINSPVGPNLETGQGTYTGRPILPQINIDENRFKQWYQQHANQWGLNPNPDDPLQFYDYRSAYRAGAAPDQEGHWPSEFKKEGHPNLIVNGINTKTGQSIDPNARMRELYQPETRATDKLNEMLSQIPERNKPGLLRKIAAMVAGVGTLDPGAADRALYAPYYRQMQDFEAKFKPVEAAAQQERMSNTNLRQIASSILTQERASEREERLSREGQERLRQGDERLRQGDERIAQSAKRMEIANKIDKGGQLQWKDDGTAVMVYKDGTIEPIDANLFSPMERMEMQQRQMLSRIGAQGAETRKTQSAGESQRQVNREKLVNQRAALRKAAVTTDKKMSVTQDAAAWNLARKQFITDNPEYADFWDPITGVPTDTAEDSDDYADAVDQIRDRYNRIKTRAGGSATPAGGVKPKGTVKVKAPDGRTGTWDLSKGPIPKGFTEIK